MRTIFYAITILAISLWGCKNQTSQDKHKHTETETHAGHSHEGHHHEGEEHDHEHEGEEHDHEHETVKEHAAHSHEETEAKHSDEIIFPKAQAAKTTFEVKERRSRCRSHQQWSRIFLLQQIDRRFKCSKRTIPIPDILQEHGRGRLLHESKSDLRSSKSQL